MRGGRQLIRRWRVIAPAALVWGVSGCIQPARYPESANADVAALPANVQPESAFDMPVVVLHQPEPISDPTERAEPQPMELAEPQPVDVFISRALAENRTVQAAYHNVLSLKERIPQVTALDDPVASNAVFPIPSVAPQYFLMGYNPYNLTLAQQFPWFGTLRLRGETAERDVQVALAELAAAQLDTVAIVKRAYYNLYAALKTEEILGENRKILEDFRTIARERVKTGGTQQDVIRSEVLLTELEREMASNRQAIAMARSALGRQLHLRPDIDLKTLPALAIEAVPGEIDRLNSLAIAARPELQGRLAAIARDEKAIELAQAILSQRHARANLHGHGADQRRGARRLPAALRMSACSSASICLYTKTSIEQASARPRNEHLPIRSFTNPSATRHTAKSRT